MMVASFSLMATACGGDGGDSDTSTDAPAADDSGDSGDSGGAKQIGLYADANGSYYDQLKEILERSAEQDPDCDWTIDYKIGQGTADDQLKAVEDFITVGYDAMVIIQNNPNTTSECLSKAKAANIPYFGAAHYFGQLDNAGDSAGSTNFDFVLAGKIAGEDALAADVSKVIMIEGVLGQGSASDQSYGFLLAYEEAGKSLGTKDDGTPWTAEEIATQKPSKVGGTPDIQVVQWASGEWVSEPAQNAMQDAISALGQDGWDGVYVHNDPMMEGVMMAVQEAGLSTENYWLGACNGRENSWQWTKDKTISMDVNQPAALEGVLLYQMIKAYFAGDDYKKHVHPYLTGYNQDTIAELEPTLVPCEDLDNFMAKMNDNSITWKIDDPKFLEIEGNW
jgi:ABC-type sugar transport system substrate-binding protein